MWENFDKHKIEGLYGFHVSDGWDSSCPFIQVISEAEADKKSSPCLKLQDDHKIIHYDPESGNHGMISSDTNIRLLSNL